HTASLCPYTTLFRSADFVQESAPEREAVKQALLARIDAVLPADIIIASSSSGLLMSRLQQSCRHPERLVIGHPFNPPHLIPLVRSEEHTSELQSLAY